MSEKKPKIVIIKEGFTATQVAEESIKKVNKASEIKNAVDIMATDFQPDESTILSNEEFGLAFTSLSDDEVEKLSRKAGVESVEDDEIVRVLEGEGCADLPEEEGDFSDSMTEEDEESALEIQEALADYGESGEDDFNFVTPEDAALAAQMAPEFDDVELDEETGEVISLDAPAAQQAEAAGIPRGKLLALVKCVIKCAIEQSSGRVEEVQDEKISELLAAFGLPTASASVQAVRDYISCGLRIIYAPQAWRFSTGYGVRVAVVDTGITPRHSDLRVYGGASFVPGVTRWHDDHGHGTHVGGTIAATRNGRGVVGVAPNARLYAVKVLNRQGSGSMSAILNGLAWCYRHRMHVVNLSLGSLASTHNTRVYSRAYENAGRLLRRRGILAVAAAGNSGRTTRPYVGNPGRCPSFMAVSAVDCQRKRASFSSYGPQVEICAPGVNVWSTTKPNNYGRKSGTSMASPHVAGVAALVKRRHPTWSGDHIRVHLWKKALGLGTPGRDWLYGHGLVRAYHSVV